MTGHKDVTVVQLMNDFEKLPPDSEVFVAIVGAGLTIPIVGLSKYTATDGKEIVVFGIPPQHVIKALEVYQENLTKQLQGEVIN